MSVSLLTDALFFANVGVALWSLLNSELPGPVSQRPGDGVTFNAKDVGDVLIKLLRNDPDVDQTSDAYKWALYFKDAKLLTLSDDVITPEDRQLVKSVKDEFEKKDNVEKIFTIRDFKPEVAWKAYQDHGKNLKRYLDENSVQAAEQYGDKMYPWLLLLANSDEDVFEKVKTDGTDFVQKMPMIGRIKIQLKSALYKMINYLGGSVQRQPEVEARSITLQDKTGARVDFSENPKALFAPPREVEKVDLGTVDLGVLGDAYICGLNPHRKRVWMLLPSCLQKFAYKKIFDDSATRIHSIDKPRHEGINLASAVLH